MSLTFWTSLPPPTPLSCHRALSLSSLHHIANSHQLLSQLIPPSTSPTVSTSLFSMSASLFSSVTQSCLTLCNPRDCSMPGFPVHHQLPELAQTHVRPSWWCHPTISSSVVPFSSCLQPFPASRSFPVGQFCTSSGQSIGVSASASVLSMNIQDWFPVGLTGLISLQYKTLKSLHQYHSSKASNSPVLSFLYSPTLTSIHNYWRNHSFD